MLDEVSGIGEGGQLVEAVSEGFPHEGVWHHMVSVDAAMDIENQLPPILWGDALHEHFRDALAIEWPTEDSVALSMPD